MKLGSVDSCSNALLEYDVLMSCYGKKSIDCDTFRFFTHATSCMDTIRDSAK